MTAEREIAAGAALLCALGALPERQRYAFVCRVLHGRTCREVADVLGVSPDRARVLSDKAHRRLEQALEPWRDDFLVAA